MSPRNQIGDDWTKASVAAVFIDSIDYPSFADTTASFVYARLMRSRMDAA